MLGFSARAAYTAAMNPENPFRSTDPEMPGDDSNVYYMFGVPISREDFDELEADLAKVTEAEQPRDDAGAVLDSNPLDEGKARPLAW